MTKRKKLFWMFLAFTLFAFARVSYAGSAMLDASKSYLFFSQAVASEISGKGQVSAQSEEQTLSDPGAHVVVKTGGRAVTPDLAGALSSIRGPEDHYYLTFENSTDAKNGVKRLKELDGVIYAEIDTVVTLDELTSEAGGTGAALSAGQSSSSSGSSYNYCYKMIGSDLLASRLAASSYAGNEVLVAIIDTGLSSSLPLFQNRTVAGANIFSGNTDTTDVNGGSGYYHGTHVAGIVADTTAGLTGIKIMPIRVFGLISGEFVTTQTLVGAGLRYAYDRGADIVNMSLNFPSPQAIVTELCEVCIESGMTVVVSSGNNNPPCQLRGPANVAEAIVVGACDCEGDWMEYSNYGTTIDISAPGDDIYSIQPDGSYQSISGTSMAAGIVSGLAAMVKMMNPEAGSKEIETVLYSNCADYGADGWDIFYGYGIPDFSGYQIPTPTPTPTVSPTPTPTPTPTVLPYTDSEKYVALGAMLKSLSVKQSGKKLVITWGKTDLADQYRVKVAARGKSWKTYKVSKNKNGIVIKKLYGEALDRTTIFRVQITAQDLRSGSEKVIVKTPILLCAGSNSKKYTNARRVSRSGAVYLLDIGKKINLKKYFSMPLEDKTKKLVTTSNVKAYRFFSTNPTVAVVSSSGKVKAKASGVTEIWAISPSGLSNYITVEVEE